MKNIAISTDSNSGITQNEAKELGIYVLPMPFMTDGETYFEDINLSHEDFYKMLGEGADILTSQPSTGSVMELWDKLLEDYDEVVHLPMSSGLSTSYETAAVLSREYNGRVQVVNNQRISATLKCSVFDALALAEAGIDAAEIKELLEKTKFESSIYIMLDTLKYIKKGGRITPAGAAIGTILNIKPVLQIQGGKLDSYAKARGVKQARKTIIEAIKNDFEGRFSDFSDPSHMSLTLVYSHDVDAALDFKKEVMEAFPEFDIPVMPISLSVACHIGPGALALACSKKIELT